MRIHIFQVIILSFIYSFSASQTTISQKKTISNYFGVSIGVGGSYIYDDFDEFLFVPPYSEFTYKPSYSFNSGISYNIDYKKLGIGTNLLLNFQQFRTKDDMGYFPKSNKELIDNYIYLSNPLYFKIILHKGRGLNIGISNNILFHSFYRNYLETYNDPTGFASHISLSDYYSNKIYCTDLYLALRSKNINKLSFDVEFLRTLQSFRTTNANDGYGGILTLNYDKYQFIFTVNYLISREK